MVKDRWAHTHTYRYLLQQKKFMEVYLSACFLRHRSIVDDN